MAAGDNTGRILIWTGFKDKVPTLHRSTPAATAVPTTSSTAAAKKVGHNSDSDSEDAQQDSAGGECQQPVAQPSSSKTNTSGEAAAAVTGSVVPSRKSTQDHFSRLQRSRASVPVTTVHWHAHPVGALCFSADGSLLLSGGEEAVLVSQKSHAAHLWVAYSYVTAHSNQLCQYYPRL